MEEKSTFVAITNTVMITGTIRMAVSARTALTLRKVRSGKILTYSNCMVPMISTNVSLAHPAFTALAEGRVRVIISVLPASSAKLAQIHRHPMATKISVTITNALSLAQSAITARQEPVLKTSKAVLTATTLTMKALDRRPNAQPARVAITA
jgi:hypothetical protein